MHGVDAIRTALQGTQHLVTWFLSDLSDADLLVRPVPGANHVAWQMGHLILSERQLLTQQLPGAAVPALPEAFLAQHANEAPAREKESGFPTRQEYVDLFTKMRQATLTALGGLSDADLDRPTQGPMAKFAPTLGALLLLVSNHSLMHGGQISVVRRKLGKPVLF